MGSGIKERIFRSNISVGEIFLVVQPAVDSIVMLIEYKAMKIKNKMCYFVLSQLFRSHFGVCSAIPLL